MSSASMWIAAVLAGAPAPAAVKRPPPAPAADPLPAALTRTPQPPAPASALPAVPRPGSANRRLPEDTGSVRVRIRKLAFNLAKSFRDLPGEGKFQTLAVLPFAESGDEAKRREVGRLVGAELASFLREDHGLLLVERERIDAALHEGYLNELGLVEEKTAVRLGELLTAQALVVGNVAVAGTEFLVNARIVSTETGEVFAAEQERLPAENLVSFASEAVVLRTRSGAVFRSVLIPGWGQFYNRQEAKGWAFLGGEMAVLGTALAFQIAGGAMHERYRQLEGAGPEAAGLREEHLKTEEGFYVARNTMLLVALGLWALNGLDAAVNGKTYDPARGGD